MDKLAWMARGDELRCFADDVSAVAYAAAYADGDDAYVVAELERIFSVRFPMPLLNAVAFPELSADAIALDDAPDVRLEDWTDALFAVRPEGMSAARPSWFVSAQGVRPGRWDDMALACGSRFMSMSRAEKLRTAREWEDDVLRSAAVRGTLESLARAAARASFLDSGCRGSPALAETLRTPAADIGPISAELRSRAESLAGLWQRALGSSSGTPRPLTLQALRSCGSTTMVTALLRDAQCPETLNLMTYLRCEDLPS